VIGCLGHSAWPPRSRPAATGRPAVGLHRRPALLTEPTAFAPQLRFRLDRHAGPVFANDGSSLPARASSRTSGGQPRAASRHVPAVDTCGAAFRPCHARQSDHARHGDGCFPAAGPAHPGLRAVVPSSVPVVCCAAEAAFPAGGFCGGAGLRPHPCPSMATASAFFPCPAGIPRETRKRPRAIRQWAALRVLAG